MRRFLKRSLIVICAFYFVTPLSFAQENKNEDNIQISIYAWSKIKKYIELIKNTDISDEKRRNYLYNFYENDKELKEKNYQISTGFTESFVSINSILKINTTIIFPERKIILSSGIEYVRNKNETIRTSNEKFLCINYETIKYDLERMGWVDGGVERGSEGVALPNITFSNKTNDSEGVIQFYMRNGDKNNACLSSVVFIKYNSHL